MPITMQQIGNKLSEVYDLTAVRSVRIHDREGIEIDRIPSWIFDSTTVSSKTTYTLHLFGSTFWLWLGEYDKVFKGYFTIIRGRRHTAWKDKSEEDRVAGFLSVQIGKRKFNCLRILGLDQDLLHPEVSITEKYIDESDRTIMARLFCSMRKSMLGGQGQKWLVDLDKESLLKINGSTFSHWYDSFSNSAFGLKTETTEGFRHYKPSPQKHSCLVQWSGFQSKFWLTSFRTSIQIKKTTTIKCQF